MLRENSSESSETKGGFDVPNNTNNDHRGGLNDSDSVNDLTLVHESTGTVDATNNVCHTGLISTEGGQMGCVLAVVLGEGPDATGMALGTLLWQEAQIALSGSSNFLRQSAINAGKRQAYTPGSWLLLSPWYQITPERRKFSSGWNMPFQT